MRLILQDSIYPTMVQNSYSFCVKDGWICGLFFPICCDNKNDLSSKIIFLS